MWNKIIAVVTLTCLLTMPWAFAGNWETSVKGTIINTAINEERVSLENFLGRLSKQTGIRIIAVPEIADMKITVQLPGNQTLEQVLGALTGQYGLTYDLNDKKNAVIVRKGEYPEFASLNAAPYVMHKTAVALETRQAMALPVAGGYYPVASFNTEEYKNNPDNAYQPVATAPLSTFSIDVDTASYSNVRRFINSGKLPPADAVRTEELVNYFAYDYPQPQGDQPFSVTTEVAACPWQPQHQLVLVGLQGKKLTAAELPPSNLVFLIDVSGSMSAPNKLPLLKTAFKLLVKQLRDEDKVAIVVYAGQAGVVLEPIAGSDKDKIIRAIDGLQAGGSTAGGEGIKLAYKTAKDNFMADGNNRVILATDGDFNVGASSEGELSRLIEDRRNDGIYLSVLGFGMGNIKDNKMEALADRGNGNYAYIDNAQEAKKVMISQLAGTLYTIAKDVKLQVEFNPALVKAYRLIGYENRKLEHRDFNDDKEDAGDMGAGQAVTALYEIIPAAAEENTGGIDSLRYQRSEIIPSADMLQVKIRYKKPGDEASSLVRHNVDGSTALANPSENLRWAAAVSGYAMLLRNSEFLGRTDYDVVLELARSAKGYDKEGYRAEFIKLVEVSRLLGE